MESVVTAEVASSLEEDQAFTGQVDTLFVSIKGTVAAEDNPTNAIPSNESIQIFCIGFI